MNTHSQSLINQASWINRAALFLVYFWVGQLKTIGTSPAEGLVTKLYYETIDGIVPLEVFLPSFGAFECLLGCMWLIPAVTRLSFWITCLHMIVAFMPMILLPGDTWESFLTLTLTGQYIMKNVILLASAWFVYRFSQGRTAVQPHQVRVKYANIPA